MSEHYHSAQFSIFGVVSLKARAGTTIGAPLVIECCGERPTQSLGSMTIFLGENYALANRLADAINAACAPVAIEEAA